VVPRSNVRNLSSYDELEQMVNLVAIDSKFDFGKKMISYQLSYLTKIIIDEPNNLFNYCNVGYQRITIHKKKLIWLKNYFWCISLREISNNGNSRACFRDADIVSLIWTQLNPLILETLPISHLMVLMVKKFVP
jgi:hypothetical protein